MILNFRFEILLIFIVIAVHSNSASVNLPKDVTHEIPEVYYNGKDGLAKSSFLNRIAKKDKFLLKNTDPEEKQTVLQLSNFALNTLENIDPDNMRKVLIDIIDSKKQFVNGVMYHLTLLVGTAKSDPKDYDAPVKESDIVEKNICKIQVLRSWAATDYYPMNAQLVESECVPTDELPRGKRTPSMFGGKTDVDVNRDDVKRIANIAIKKLDDSKGLACNREVVKILNAKRQTVSGVLYDLKINVCEIDNCNSVRTTDMQNRKCEICDITIVEKHWLGTSDIKTFKCSSSPSESQERVKRLSSYSNAEHLQNSIHNLENENHFRVVRSPRRGVVVGGKQPVDVERDDVKNIAKLAIKEQDQSSGSCVRELIRVLQARTQVVAGVLYDLKTEICEIESCKKSSIAERYCEICDITVVEQGWLNSVQTTKFECVPKESSTSSADKSRPKRSGEFYEEHFFNFIEKFNKTYPDSLELENRYRIFRANMKKIEYLQKTEQGTAIYGVTEFSDLTKSEFRKYYLGFNPELQSKDPAKLKIADIPDIKIPDEYDWRAYNIVTPVKNQGFCGSCWAFSVTGNIEGQWALKHKKLVSFSEQELVDCDTLDAGCEGGYMVNGYKTIEKLGGLEPESDYPYKGVDEKCGFAKNHSLAVVTDYVNITTNETKIAQWLFKNGPISVGINANAMQFYFGGVSHPLKFLCDPNDIDHGVLLVGYGVHKTKFTHKYLPYWLIKNSWGKFWGEKGYYMLYRGSGACGINTFASSAIVG